jgi:hypothetical protein
MTLVSKWPKGLIMVALILNLASCSMLGDRTYLAEMAEEEGGFYSPGDFPVVPGDTGELHETSDERRRRTPAWERDSEDADGHLLTKQLNELEQRQSEEDLATYLRYKPDLKTVSEKIYYLKLSSSERRDYLESRGFLSSSTGSSMADYFSQRSDVVTLGMSKSDVMGSIGRPNRVEIAGNPNFENERWLYSVNGAKKYIYFESGRVEGWE